MLAYVAMFAMFIFVYVTEFVKRGLIHTPNFSTLRMRNSASIGSTALKFGSKSSLSLF